MNAKGPPGAVPLSAPDSSRYTEMKTKRVFFGIVAASTLAILLLIVAIFNSYDEEWLIRFLNQYGTPEQRSPWATDYESGEYVRYHFKADYDTFTEAAKSELIAQGFSDITKPNEDYKLLVYERQAFEDIRVEIRFAIIRSGPAINNPIHSWIDVTVNRTKPRSRIKYYWNNLKRAFVRIKFKLKYH